MQPLVSFLTALGGLTVSIVVAVLVEEFIFGQILKTFFAQPKPSAATQVLRNWMVQPVKPRGIAPR